jgi:hypothetical protein
MGPAFVGGTLAAGKAVCAKANLAVTAASTLAVDGGGAIAIKVYDGAGIRDTQTGDMIANGIYFFAYSTTGPAWILINPTIASPVVYQTQGDVLDALNTLGAPTADGEFVVASAPGVFAYETAGTARASLGLVIGTDVQAFGAVLEDLNTLGPNAADSEFLVGTAAGALAWETGATVRASLGLGTWALETLGSETVIIPPRTWLPEDGAAGPELATVALANHDYEELLFDGAATETAFWKFRAPKSSDETGTLDFTVSYAPKGTSSGNVRFQFSALAVGAGDTIDAAFGTAVADDSAAGATANVLRRSGTMSVTVGGTWAEGDTIYVKMESLGGHANDTNTDDRGVQEVQMLYTINAGNDD